VYLVRSAGWICSIMGLGYGISGSSTGNGCEFSAFYRLGLCI